MIDDYIVSGGSETRYWNRDRGGPVAIRLIR
jgi:hypothetical protein